MLLPDGTVFPSYLGSQDTVANPEPSEHWNNYGLKMGQVTDIIYPTDPKSVSKRFIEYKVEVQYRDRQGQGVTSVFPHCFPSSVFGGSADLLRFTYRKRPGEITKDGVGLGSKVLILCINGEIGNAVIIGGVRDNQGDSDTDEGHNLRFQFHGVHSIIDRDGAFSLIRLGPTDEKGVSQGDGTQTLLSFDRDGGIVLGHETNKLKLDEPNKSWTLGADKNVSILAGTEIYTNSGGPTTLDSTGVLTLASQTMVRVGSSASNQQLIRGTAYRAAETSMHMQMVAGLSALAGQLSAVATLLTTAGGMMVVPVAGAIAASIPLASAGATLATATASVAQLIAAISTFESTSLPHLSTKVFTD